MTTTDELEQAGKTRRLYLWILGVIVGLSLIGITVIGLGEHDELVPALIQPLAGIGAGALGGLVALASVGHHHDKEGTSDDRASSAGTDRPQD